MTAWDALRAKQRGNRASAAPRCSRCQRRSVYDVCRRCATPAELARTFHATSNGKPVDIPWYPPLEVES